MEQALRMGLVHLEYLRGIRGIIQCLLQGELSVLTEPRGWYPAIDCPPGRSQLFMHALSISAGGSNTGIDAETDSCTFGSFEQDVEPRSRALFDVFGFQSMRRRTCTALVCGDRVQLFPAFSTVGYE